MHDASLVLSIIALIFSVMALGVALLSLVLHHGITRQPQSRQVSDWPKARQEPVGEGSSKTAARGSGSKQEAVSDLAPDQIATIKKPPRTSGGFGSKSSG